jgi:hypothetical protein
MSTNTSVIAIPPNLLYDKKASALKVLNPTVYNYIISAFSFWKSVRLATTENIVLSGLQIIDGKQTIDGDRVLVKDQTDFTTEGVYVVSNDTWSRSQDCLVGTVASGMVVYVADGINYAKNYFVCTSPPVSYVGISDLQFYNTSSTSFFPLDPGLITAGAVFYNIDGVIGVQLENGYIYIESPTDQVLKLSKTAYTNRLNGSGDISLLSGDNATGKGGNFTVTGNNIYGNVSGNSNFTATGDLNVNVTNITLTDTINNKINLVSDGLFDYNGVFTIDGTTSALSLPGNVNADASPIVLGNKRQGFINLVRSIAANGTVSVDITTNNYSSTLSVNIQTYAGTGKPVVWSLQKTPPNQISIIIKNYSTNPIVTENIQIVYVFL